MTDILDLIDNATEHLCACGCTTKLPEDGPSAWFASQDCQRRWNEAHATDPDDVYRRPDGGDGWSWDAMVVGDGGTFAGTRFFLGEEEITDYVVPGSLAFERCDQADAIEAFMRTVVTPEAMEGRSGLIYHATTPAGISYSWVDEVRDYWSPRYPSDAAGLYRQLSAEDAGWRLTPDSSDEAHHYATARPSLRPVLDAATPVPWPDYVTDRIAALPDASMTITGFYEPYGCWIDETVWVAANRRPKIRRMHTSYGRRLRSRRRRNRR